ncbi:hypothetical protein NV391_02570 [Companilactobacillus crustorum]|uniref:Uncharacterized protein n=1 Tax=Companilactobacillus nuruki TaxID=1993540 RepID=A0A2N7ATY5_9LACO|nr:MULTISPECIES: hypothetical protein [Companilactobacillus]PMD70251.1 hypothetical protein CBP76_07095 [Companilactobacillus nuruki]WDT66109.1 hypothetical protein NV391_02570 [Companilactobacillus crustorum]
MTQIRMMVDPNTGKRFYVKTHVLGIDGLQQYVDDRVALKDDSNKNYAKYIEDLNLIDNSGLFYFDQDTKNKPSNIEKGYLRAIFMDSKNGVIEVTATNNYFEIVDGQLSDIKERG